MSKLTFRAANRDNIKEAYQLLARQEQHPRQRFHLLNRSNHFLFVGTDENNNTLACYSLRILWNTATNIKTARIDQIGISADHYTQRNYQSILADAKNRAINHYGCSELQNFNGRISTSKVNIKEKEIDPIEELASKWKARL